MHAKRWAMSWWTAGLLRMHCHPPGAAAEVDHAMVCENAAKMTPIRYWALTGKKGMAECQRRADIMAVLLRLEISAVEVVVASILSSHRLKFPSRDRTSILMPDITSAIVLPLLR